MGMKFVFSLLIALLHGGLSEQWSLDFKSKPCEGVDVVFLLDTSRSVSLSDFKRQLNFTNSIIDQFDIGKGKHQVRVGVALIGVRTYLQYYLRTISEKERLKYAISHIRHRYSPYTDTASAIKFVTKHMFEPFFGGRENATHVLIIITDGLSQKQKETKEAAKSARDAGTRVFAIGIGSVLTDVELRNIASQPYDRFMFSVPNFKALDSIKSYMPASACDIPTPEPTTTTTTATTTTTTTPTTPTTTTTTFPTKSPEVPVSSASNRKDSYAKSLSPKHEFAMTTNLTSVTDRENVDKELITTTKIKSLQTKMTTGPSISEESSSSQELSETTSLESSPTTDPKDPPSPTEYQSTSTPKTPTTATSASSTHRSLSQSSSTLKSLLEPNKEVNPQQNIVPEVLKNVQEEKNDMDFLETSDNNKIPLDIAISDDPKQYCGGKDADVFFLLDSSSSIWPEDFKKQLQFVNSLVETFDFNNNKTRVGVLVYSNKIQMKVALDSRWSKQQIKRQVAATEYISGLTNTSDAIEYLRKYGFTERNARKNALKIGIVMTDGISRDPAATKEESIKCRKDGITLFAIGIGKDIDKTELKRIANDPDDKYVFHVNSFAALATIRSMVAISACGAIPDQPSNMLSCGSGVLADVIFVYDAAALGARKSQLLTSFVYDVTKNLQLSPEFLRIGRRTDNCPSISDIGLTSSNDNDRFATLEFPGLEMMIRKLWNYFPGRLDSKNLAVLFVDESSQNIETATRLLKNDKNFKVMVVAIGDASMARIAGDLASEPAREYLVNIPSYMSLASSQYEFLQKLCYLITNEAMYLRDARYRQP